MTALAERLAAALVSPAETALIESDQDDLPGHEAMAAAAVLVPITDRPRPGLILTQRTETLRKHAGQVAFPGGRIDPGEDAVAAALREADEEIALPRDAVRVIGAADRYRTGTGFSITPIVAIVPPDLALIPSEAEVASVFEVPLDFVLDSANHRAVSAMWQGRERHYYEMIWQDRRIWGATAGMIVNLSRRLRWGM
ncbi:CoA pyrophosphatase [Sphingomonas adhaesiva]|jgi:8-oxo-dGTP pyrophosphatase MutT (NUDIX family)|uniref:Coenzyme A pyrophosphatase n=1 Tax=Sphingomonas adhaesiva TaxID=28212 RepID=A0A2A4I6B7_9SPHN|nr:CoA pyrophosphatase [Sphingomonas adhaesiva]PCG13323.1 coenzyme A pyrophosphatase [Sphingomonas adhaesiva]